MPIPWQRVEDPKLSPTSYAIEDVLKARGDPWQGWRRHARSLKEPRKRLDRMIQSWQERHQ